MNDIEFSGVQKRIDFYGRWGLAFFTTFVVLVSYLCGSYAAGDFGILFKVGLGAAVGLAAIWGHFFVAALRLIKRLEKYRHV